MKNLLLFSFIVASLSLAEAQNIDSLFYNEQDTTGLAAEIRAEELAWRWTDTLSGKDYSNVDEHVSGLKNKYKSIPVLAKDLTEPFSNDEDKIRAIFTWMVSNIVYDYLELKRNKKSKGRTLSYSSKTPKQEIAKRWEKIYYDYATQVLKKKRGICEGYATLFYELCKASNINCEMVNGYAGNDLEKVKKYKRAKSCPTVHAWNKVMLNGEWLYIDVTWASTGKFDGKRTEPESYNPYYYLTTEDKLYDTHIENKKRTVRRNELVGNY
jgi:transglutaminase/protease-like cytokinesis protein 3